MWQGQAQSKGSAKEAGKDAIAKKNVSGTFRLLPSSTFRVPLADEAKTGPMSAQSWGSPERCNVPDRLSARFSQARNSKSP